jgi:hypothetical protein
MKKVINSCQGNCHNLNIFILIIIIILFTENDKNKKKIIMKNK